MSERTPIPWKVIQTNDRCGLGSCCTVVTAKGNVVAAGIDKATAEFIVKAANNHEELVEALQGAISHEESATAERAYGAGFGAGEWEAFVPQWWQGARALLAKIGGE